MTPRFSAAWHPKQCGKRSREKRKASESIIVTLFPDKVYLVDAVAEKKNCQTKSAKRAFALVHVKSLILAMAMSVWRSGRFVKPPRIA
jgi:hypothetical protein